MCWCVGLGQELSFLHEKKICLKFLKKELNRKDGRGNKNFKKRGKLGQGVGALKMGGWNPDKNWEY